MALLSAEPFPQSGAVVGFVRVDLARFVVQVPFRVVFRLEGLDQRDQAVLVMDVAGGDADDERQPCPVGQDVHFGAGFAPADGAGTGVSAPFFARTCTESAITRDTSSMSAATRRSSIARRSRPHSPFLVQIVKRRCTVDFDKPKHGGRYLHAHLVVSTWTIAANTASSSRFAVPPPCGRTRAAGSNGSTKSHEPSVRSDDPASPTTSHDRPYDPAARAVTRVAGTALTDLSSGVVASLR